ncbi:hypothetical protein BN1708_018525, partial [Verticillium longisporum]
VLRRH